MKKSDTASTGTDSNLKRAEIIDLSQCYSDMHSIEGIDRRRNYCQRGSGYSQRSSKRSIKETNI